MLINNWKIRGYLIANVLIASVLVFIWFRSGEFLAAAEEGPSFFKPSLTASKYSEPWAPVGTGYLFPVGVPRVTFYIFAAFLNGFLEIWKVQAIVFWILACVGVVGTYFLTHYITGGRKAAFFSSLFYLLNIYSLSQVWSRFIYAGMFAWAYLPGFLFLVVKWIDTHKIRWIFTFVVTSIVFSNTFGTPAFVFTFWTPAFLYALFFNNRVNRGLVKRITYFSIIFGAWVVANIWWIYPFLAYGESAYVRIGDVVESNLGSLRTVSQFFPIKTVLLLRQDFLLGVGSWWYDFYNNPFVIFLSILILLVALFGWLKSRSSLRRWGFLTVWAFISLFVIKGSGFPFGNIFYRFLFETFPSTMSLRNPYEKFGISWLLVYSIFFGWGIGRLLASGRKIVRFLLFPFLFLVYVLLVLPFWNGQVFPDAYGYRINVPDYYQDLDNWFRRNQVNGKVIFLPLVPDEGVRYTWGYGGIEPSEFLFTPITVSKILRVEGYYDKYKDMYNAFTSGVGTENLLEEMNIEYIVLHEDIDIEVTKSTSSAHIKKFIQADKNLTFIDKFGDLELYRNSLNNPSLFLVEGNTSTNLSYRKLSNSCYTVDVSGARAPFQLVFKETFSKVWEARIGGELIADHRMVYNYANQWEVDREGDYQIKISLRNWVCSSALGNIQRWLLMQE